MKGVWRTRTVLMPCGHVSTVEYLPTSPFGIDPCGSEVKCSECGRLGFAKAVIE